MAEETINMARGHVTKITHASFLTRLIQSVSLAALFMGNS